MTIFTNFFTFHLAMPILDNFFLEGWQGIYRISIALMLTLEA
jgi:hypothetical protein